ncbi:MAG: CHAT domain-containing tetratricopeptide repeat protein [Terracidiphilus sp.]
MRARGIAFPTAIVSAVLIFTALFADRCSPLQAQQPTGAAPASPSTTLPAGVQAKLDKLQADLKAARSNNDAKAEAAALNAIGNLYFGVSAYPQAMDNYSQALARARAAKDALQEAAALNGTGDCYRKESRAEKASEAYEGALKTATVSGDRRGEAAALDGLGWIQRNTGKPQESLEFFNRALKLAQAVGDKKLTGSILRGIGVVYDDENDLHQALDYYNQALTSFREADDRSGEAATMGNIGGAYEESGEMQKALDYYNRALPLLREAGDRSDQATNLINTGNVYNVQGDMKQALAYYNQALPIFRELDYLEAEGVTLDNIGAVYRVQGRMQEALDAFQQALVILRQANDPENEAAVLVNTATVYSDLGDGQRALDFNQQALPIFRQVHDRSNEATVLVNIANEYSELAENEKALDFLNQALPILQETGDRDAEANALNIMGVVFFGLGERQKALDHFNQALTLLRDVGDRQYEAEALGNIGDVYRDQKKLEQAFRSYDQALALAAAVGDRIVEANIFYSLMLNEQSRKPALAIYYGKQAVNLLQEVRGNIEGLDKELQKSFLASKGDCYHDLANLLIDEGRLPEAQQVLDLLKQQEYSEFVRGDTANTLSPLALTPAEQQAEEDYTKSTGQIVTLGEQWAALKKITARTPEQEQQYQQLSEQLNTASKGMNEYYARLYTLFGSSSGANKQVADVKGDVSLLRQALAKMPHAVALYTLVGSERYSVIVVTGSTAVAREYPITQKDLNQKVAALQRALRDPESDPRPPARELYEILLGPVKADLDQAQAQTLVWSLDGALRYVPMAALFDGKQYVVEQYSSATITPVSIAHLLDRPDFTDLNAAAMGISRQYEVALPALPAVVGELDEVVSDVRTKGAQGVLPGTILLDGSFTEKGMENLLSSPHTVVHIASHFVFQPGDESQSYLLLAGKDQEASGYHLTVAGFRDDQQLSLEDTDLLTLSACETGMSGSAGNGREVDGLGTTAQLKGAKAVISTLWEVNDASTGALMADFYKRWTEGAGKVSKVEALRQAQLDLLQHRVAPKTGESGTGVSVVESVPGKLRGPTGYAHPYYWAPFVLMGNWK